MNERSIYADLEQLYSFNKYCSELTINIIYIYIIVYFMTQQSNNNEIENEV